MRTLVNRGSSRRRSAPRIALLGVAAALGLSAVAADAEWQNPSERYARVHEDYAGAQCPIPADGLQHFVYFARDRGAIRGHAFLNHPRFVGAQIMYPWSLLEPSEGRYDFSQIEEDLEYLASQGKTLFVQLQDTTFNPGFKATPDYVNAPEYGGGSVLQESDAGIPEGWAAKRWHPQVRDRFAALLAALGEAFDGKIAGLNLQETALGVEGAVDFQAAEYVEAVKGNMRALKQAFPRSASLQYANFMPGEWLPWEDRGYLRGVYRYGQEIGVGLGAPDLMMRRKGQLNHALAMMHELELDVPLGIAIQDGNYAGATGADFPPGTEVPVPDSLDPRENLVPKLQAFAKGFLGVQFMFWVNQEPYFSRHVLPCFAGDGADRFEPSVGPDAP
ncbi:MAG: hypothetical protein AAGM22_13590 [Acidobacteriota bacterium]